MKPLEELFAELENAVSIKRLREKRLHFFLDMLVQEIKNNEITGGKNQ